MAKDFRIRMNGDVKIIELKGKIAIGSGDLLMRETIHRALADGSKNILIDMAGVTAIDSSGVGELVGCYTTATNREARLKLLNLPAKIQDVLTITQLITVFDVYENEEEAVASFA